MRLPKANCYSTAMRRSAPARAKWCTSPKMEKAAQSPDLKKAFRGTAPRLPIILTTGYADIRSPSYLAYPRLPKPYTQDQLTQMLEATVK